MSPARSRRSVTIDDVALRAGVSRSSVSLSVNGKPGVAAATRARVLTAAEELGWRPHHAARALRGVHDTAVGLVITRSPRQLSHEPFWTHFIAGIGKELGAAGHALKLCLASDAEHESRVYRQWWAQQRVCGVIVVDVRHDDERLRLLRELSMPAVIAGPPHLAGGIPAVWSNDEACMDTVVRYLAAMRHRRIAWVTDNPALGHAVVRTESFTRAADDLGLEAVTATQGADPDVGRATRALLAAERAPTAVIHESTMAAIAALGVAKDMGIRVPGSLSILAWDDSPLCQVTQPALSVVRHDLYDYGARTARGILGVVEGSGIRPDPPVVTTLQPRGSTSVLHQQGHSDQLRKANST